MVLIEKITLIYDDYSNTFENIQNIYKILKKDSIKDNICNIALSFEEG